MLVLMSFAAGYGLAVKKEVNLANEYLSQYNCLPKTGGFNNYDEETGYAFNTSLYEESIRQENTIQ